MSIVRSLRRRPSWVSSAKTSDEIIPKPSTEIIANRIYPTRNHVPAPPPTMIGSRYENGGTGRRMATVQINQMHAFTYAHLRNFKYHQILFAVN